MFSYLFNYYLKNINNLDNDINVVFLSNMDKKYLENTSDVRKVIDYIAGMTDDFFIEQYNKYKI